MNTRVSLLIVCAFCACFGLSNQAFSQNNVTVDITTDCWGAESFWQITDSGGAILASVASGTMANDITYTTVVDLPDGCYTFSMGDTYGDGMQGSIWGGCDIDGNYLLSDALANPLVTMPTPAFGTGVDHMFNVPFGDVLGCLDTTATNFDSCANVEDGSCTYPPLAPDFSFFAPSYCEGTNVAFTDLSIGSPSGWNWTFPTGTPANSTDQNPTVQFNTAGTHSVVLEIHEDPDGEIASISYDVTIVTGLSLEVVIVQDNYPGETSWDLVNEFGMSVAVGDVNGATVCIEDNCHIFTIYDSYGDGICCGYGNGSYSLLLNGVEIGSGGQFGNEEVTNINCPPGSDCNNTITAIEGTNTAPVPNSWFTFTPAANGQYMINTCGLATCDTEIWMYDYCNMANFDDTNEGTLTWNDDFCGVQSQITPLLAGGTTYFLRIGDQGSACGTGPIDFLIEYMGPISGCMDPLACNFLPIAESPDVCYYPGDIQCPSIGPDLEVLGDVFYDSMYFTVLNNTDACYVNEGCMQGFGDREIVRFTTHIKNIGTEDYFIGAPANQPDQFEWDDCHNHWHYEGYAEYVLYDGTGAPMPQIGFKNGFCVLDLECSDGGTATYTCGFMGISAQCGDIYSSGLSCQWIDVTDVPGGSYTMLIRTNWDGSPDANGSYELSYDNNWAAVCISFDRDIDGNLINFTKSLECGIIFDCFGTPFGTAEPDCAGNCPGVVATGDVDNSGDLAAPDVTQYIADILGNDGVVSPCTDLNSDGDINVTDAAIAAGCVFYGPDHVDELGVHDHCVWDSEIINPAHNVTLSIGDVDDVLGYVDVHILNPDNEVVAYEFDVSGITIQSVESLMDPLVFDAVPQGNLGGTKVVCVALNDMDIPKNLAAVPFVRIYYFNVTDPQVCVSAIGDIVNLDYHNTLTTIGTCMSINNTDFADFTSTSTTVCQGGTINFQDLSTNAPIGWSWTFSGGSPTNSSDQHPSGIAYSAPGVYDVTLTATSGSGVDSETKFGYISVSAADGCTDTIACNYDSTANCDDGSCLYADACGVCGGSGTVAGCTDTTACNYDSTADCDDGSCTVDDACGICGGAGTVAGCTDTTACNYDSLADCDDGSCTVDDACGVCGGSGTVAGCTDTTACNYDSTADCDNGSCAVDDACGVCGGPGTVAGCTDTTACNYDSTADCDNGSCTVDDACGVCGGAGTVAGCTDTTACNYDSLADCDDGSCTVDDACGVCGGDGTVAGCTDTTACNYDSTADCDNGSCAYPSNTYYADTDLDGFGANTSPITVCGGAPIGYVADDTDCDDSNANAYPGAPGTGDGIDNNCNGLIEGDELSTVCAGDFNGDGEVNVSDLLEFLAAYGCMTDCGIYDLSGDGLVNSEDLLDFLPSYGQPCP